MNTLVSGYSGPQLVTLQGEDVYLTPADWGLFRKGYITEQEHNYLCSRYPELMGGFSFKGLVKGIGKGIKGVVMAPVNAVKSVIKGASGADEREAAAAKQLALMQQQEAQKKEQIKKMLMIGIPAALALLLIMQRR